MGLLDEFKSVIKDEAADVKKMINKNFPKSAAEPEKTDKDELKDMESELFMQIGKMAVTEFGAEKFGEAGSMLLEVQQMIAEREEESRRNAEQVCQNCGYVLHGSPKFCPECGTKIETKEMSH
ncbi:MAG: zinc ribbon domain-containing protein [Methanocorpusculum sp.]|nr:zinc ribbon domain-containing protein [Methanocorpusculum sp.]